MDPYTTYYFKQAQTGRGESYSPQQRGHGLGTFLTNVFKTAFPYVRDGFIALKDEFLSNGFGLLSDVVAKRKPMNESLKDRVRTFGSNLTERAVNTLGKNMAGSGSLKRRAQRTKAHSSKKRRRRTTRMKGPSRKVIKRKRKPAKRLKRAKGSKKHNKKSKKRLVRRRKTAKHPRDIFG